jgi:hypothetical protein
MIDLKIIDPGQCAIHRKGHTGRCQRSPLTFGDLDCPFLALRAGFLGDGHLQDAFLEGRLHLFRVQPLRKFHPALEVAVAALGVPVTAFLVLLFLFLLAFDGQRIGDEVDFNVLVVEAG